MNSRYDEEMRRQKEVLDQFDFQPYLDIYDDVDDLMFNFEYECNLDLVPSDFKGHVFNYFGTEDFIDYLEKRYPKYRFDEVTRYRIRRIK